MRRGEDGVAEAVPQLAPVEAAPIPATPELERCLNLVEPYQPLYGIRGFEAPLRACRDRALVIESALASPTSPGSGWRLIDFGSSLGYFPFYFADRGAVTTGYDIRPENTAVAVATQRLTGLPATFRTLPLHLDTVRAIAPRDYDVALILSVLHHIIHQRGLDYVRQIIAELLERIPNLVLELARRDEPVAYPWRQSLPEDPLAILAGCPGARVDLLGEFPSHLSGAARPMYLISRPASA
jgi:O-antigen chain-terminating methyltransferase